MTNRALRIGVLLSAACVGCAPAGEMPDPRFLDEAAAVARGIPGPVAVLIDPVPHVAPTGSPLEAESDFVAADPVQIERVRDDFTVIVPPALRTRLELLGYVLATVPEAGGWTRIAGRLNCASVRTTSWSPLPGLEFSGRIGIDLPASAGGEMVLVVGDHGSVRLVAETPSGADVPLVVEPLQNAPGTAAPPADFWLERNDPDDAPPEVVRVRVPAVPDDRRLVGLRFGRRAPQVLARLRGVEGDARARVCAAPLGGDDVVTSEGGVAEVSLDRPELYGAGWFGEENLEEGRLRWAGGDGTLLLPSAVSGPVHLEVEAMPPPGGLLPSLEPIVNGIPLASETMTSGFHVYSWHVPKGVWLLGTNEIVLRVSTTTGPAQRVGTDRRELGLGVKQVRIRVVQ